MGAGNLPFPRCADLVLSGKSKSKINSPGPSSRDKRRYAPLPEVNPVALSPQVPGIFVSYWYRVQRRTLAVLNGWRRIDSPAMTDRSSPITFTSGEPTDPWANEQRKPEPAMTGCQNVWAAIGLEMASTRSSLLDFAIQFAVLLVSHRHFGCASCIQTTGSHLPAAYRLGNHPTKARKLVDHTRLLRALTKCSESVVRPSPSPLRTSSATLAAWLASLASTSAHCAAPCPRFGP